jgi:hypothetical protein
MLPTIELTKKKSVTFKGASPAQNNKLNSSDKDYVKSFNV